VKFHARFETLGEISFLLYNIDIWLAVIIVFRLPVCFFGRRVWLRFGCEFGNFSFGDRAVRRNEIALTGTAYPFPFAKPPA